jgi:hypothetical protein
VLYGGLNTAPTNRKQSYTIVTSPIGINLMLCVQYHDTSSNGDKINKQMLAMIMLAVIQHQPKENKL